MSRLGRPDRDPSAMRKRKLQSNGPSHDKKKKQEVKKPKNVPYTQEEHDLEVSLFGYASRAEPIPSTFTSTSTSKSSTSKSSASASTSTPTTRLTSHHDDVESDDDDDLEAAAIAWDEDKSGQDGDISTFMFAEDKSGSAVATGDEDADEDVEHEEKTAPASSTPVIPIETSVWHDEDDDHVQVNLAAIPKLRKLREHEGETIISGGEYQKRLRNTFQQFNPTASWAKLPESTTSKNHDLDDDDDDEKHTANWPTSNTPLRYVSSVAFSPNSGYLACGNDGGKVLLYPLNHFSLAS